MPCALPGGAFYVYTNVSHTGRASPAFCEALLEAGVDEEDLARATGLGRGRLRRLGSLLELHPVLRQALREGCLRPQVAFAVSGLSPSSQEELAALYQREGELSTADLKRVGENASDPDRAAAPEPPTVAGGPAGAAPDSVSAPPVPTTNSRMPR